MCGICENKGLIMKKFNLSRSILLAAVTLGLSSVAIADGPMTPPNAPTSKSDAQVQKARQQQRQNGETHQQWLDRQQYQQSEPVLRDVPEPDDLFDD